MKTKLAQDVRQQALFDQLVKIADIDVRVATIGDSSEAKALRLTVGTARKSVEVFKSWGY